MPHCINTVIYYKMQMQFRKVVVIKITKRSLKISSLKQLTSNFQNGQKV